VDPRFKAALVMAHETGHRIGGVASLRWSDLDLDGGWVRRNKQTDKIGLEHTTPLTEQAVEALRELQSGIPRFRSGLGLPFPGESLQALLKALIQGLVAPRRSPGRHQA